MSEGDRKITDFRAIGNRVYTNKVRLRGLREQVESRKHYDEYYL